MKARTKTREPEVSFEELAVMALPEREAMTLCAPPCGLDLCISVHVNVAVNLGGCNPCSPCYR